MKITYLISALDGGGAALPVADLIGVMRSLGHDVEVIGLMPKDGRACARLDAAGIRYRIIGQGTGDYLKPAWRLLRYLRRNRPALIWTSVTRATFYGQLAGGLLGIPVISWQHNAFLKPAKARVLRLTKGLSARWVADSEAVRDFAHRALDIDPGDIDVWPLFVADADQPMASPWHPGEAFRIGSLGRLHANKDYALLIEAAALIRDRDPALAATIAFSIAGVGPQEAALRAAMVARGVGNVELLGFRTDAMAYLASLHAYVQPSRHEGLCIAAHEAMMAGLPVITTPVGELTRSIVAGETGLFHPIGDAGKLADAILTLVRDPAQAHWMGAAGRARVAARYSRAYFEQQGRACLTTIAAMIGQGMA